MGVRNSRFFPGWVVEYCDELWVCLSVCLSASMSPKLRVRSSPNFLCLLPVAVAQPSAGDIEIRYAPPVNRFCEWRHISYNGPYAVPLSILLQRMTSLHCRQQANVPAASYQLHHVSYCRLLINLEFLFAWNCFCSKNIQSARGMQG